MRLRCGGRGVCGCGESSCAVLEWWRVFQTQWRYIAWQMIEERNEMTDNAIDFERESAHE